MNKEEKDGEYIFADRESSQDVVQNQLEIVGTAVDDVYNVIASRIPGYSVIRDLSNAFYGAAVKVRQQRAIEFVVLIQDNPDVFGRALLEREAIQDGVVNIFECYLRERDTQKRVILSRILLGFVRAQDPEHYPLERFTHTLTQVSEIDMEVLGRVDINMPLGEKNYQIYPGSKERISNIQNLVNLGILLDHSGSRIGPITGPFVEITDFGREFRAFLVAEVDNS